MVFLGNKRVVWSDQKGDVRSKDKTSSDLPFDETNLELMIRRLTSGKGRTVIEITGLPSHKKWCEALAKDLKKSLGVGGTYKQGYIEIHGEKMDEVTSVLDKKSLQWKKTGG